MKKSIFFAALLINVPLFASAASQQRQLANVVLSVENASYMVKEVNEVVYVATFGYKNPAETCKFLQNKGVNVFKVTNYDESTGRSTKKC